MSNRRTSIHQSKNVNSNIMDEQNTIQETIRNKFLNESDIVVNEIIEKLISLAISSNFTNNINNQLSSSCYEFIKLTLDNYLSSNFIYHDIDETYQNSFNNSKSQLIPETEHISIINELPINDSISINNNNTQINIKLEQQMFFNNYTHGENDWGLMDEPESNKFDRYANTLIKYKEIEKEKAVKYNNNAQVLEEVTEESEKNSIINNNNNEKNESTQIKDNFLKKNRFTNKATTKKKRNLMDVMNQFSFHDLDDNNDLYKESKEINYEQLRKEAQEKDKVVNEEKKIHKKAKIEVENKIKAENEKNRQFAGKKITVDANGQIVFIKGIKLEKLNKEFNLLKTATKLIKDEQKEKEKEKKPKKKKKIEEIAKNEKKEEIEKNKAPENPKVKPIKLLPKVKSKFRTSTKETEEQNQTKSRLLKRLEEGPIILSGSNFAIMNMEVGVSLKENEKIKSGGKDFYHKYNKYSMDNYNKQLKETTEVNSFLKTHAEIENPNTKSDMNYIANLTDTYNSSIGFINNSNYNQQITSSNKNYQLTNFNTMSNFGNKPLLKTRDINSSFSPNLKLTGGFSSLVGSMEKLNLITERQERIAKKTENIFKKNLPNYSSAKELVLPKLEEINKFTTEILTSNNWMKKQGVNNMVGSPFRNPGKPGFKQICREMGIKGKILRNRMKKNITSTEGTNPALEAVDFFKK
jgi:hypothetical protein